MMLSVLGGRPQPGDYSVSVHVRADRFLSDCSAGPKVCFFTLQLLHVVIDGKNTNFKPMRQNKDCCARGLQGNPRKTEERI